MSASSRIPPLVQPFISDRAKKTLDIVCYRYFQYLNCLRWNELAANTWRFIQVEEFVEKECIPADALFQAQLGEGESRWTRTPQVIEDLKVKAKKLGLWNMFLPKNHFSQGAGFSNAEYGLMAEILGKSRIASEVSLQMDMMFGYNSLLRTVSDDVITL